jgi:hypothetical protein
MIKWRFITKQANSLKTIKEDNVTSYGTEFYSNDDSLKLKYNKRVYLYDIAAQKKELLNYSEVSDFNEDGIFAAKNSITMIL